jgi:membrane-associated phospholipid phosphatase
MPLAQLGSHFRRLWLLKAIGTTLFMYAFFSGYFYLLQHPAYPPIDTPVTAIDRGLPYQQWAWGLYASLWIYTSLPVAFQPNLRSLLYYGLSAFVLCATGLAIFYFFPTIIPESFLMAYRGAQIQLLAGIDASGNAAPSLHVAAAIFSMLWLRRQLIDVKAPLFVNRLNYFWCTGIVYSTMATKQHVLTDVASGAIFGLLFALLSLYGLRHLSRLKQLPIRA